MSPQVIRKIELAGGADACHRKQPILLPDALGVAKLVHQPCLGKLCTLWDPANNQCIDVSNADSLAMIATGLDGIIKQLDVLSFHAGEK